MPVVLAAVAVAAAMLVLMLQLAAAGGCGGAFCGQRTCVSRCCCVIGAR